MNTTLHTPLSDAYINGINHHDFYLWDAWSYQEAEELHLYCLAVSRYDENDRLLDPKDRNNVPFHVQHFVSTDTGESWTDAGCLQKPRPEINDFDSKSIWSSSITLLDDGRKLIAFTGLKAASEPQLFLQSMGVAISHDGYEIDPESVQLISSPVDDWQMIIDKGYFIGSKNNLGHMDGEEGGPILAWRDPYILIHEDEIHMFWCAKSSSHTPALGHAILVENSKGFQLSKLYQPTVMPDSDAFTQLELPKVIYDDVHNKFYLIIATCNRMYEGQADSEVDKQIRLYQSESLDGPWRYHFDKGSSLDLGANNMFALTVLNADYETGQLLCIAPYTEAAEKPLTLSKSFIINLNRK